MITEAILGTITEAVLSRVLEHAEPRLGKWLRGEPARLAFQTALARAYTRFDREYPEWSGSLFDEAFLTREDVSEELSKLLTRDGKPLAEKIATSWADYFPGPDPARRVKDLTPAVGKFLEYLEAEARQQEALRPLYDSRDLAKLPHIAAEVAELRRLLEQALEQALATARYAHTHSRIDRAYPQLKEYTYDFTEVIARGTLWFVGRRFVFEAVKQFVREHPCGYFCITADAGLGKTALAAALTQRYDALVHFFNASEGITSPERCLNHLCAQLIARYDLPYTQLPQRAGEDAGFIRKLLAEAAAKQPPGCPLVLVVDALDEADATPAGHNWVHLPTSLPEGVFFILTQRPGSYTLQTDASTPLKPFPIAWDAPEQQKDIERHLRRQAARPEIRRALEAATPAITLKRFVAALKERSEGNFKYLDYVLADIEAREPGFDPLDLEGLPHGLVGYYETFWTRMQEMGRAEGWTEWRTLYKPTITFLAAAGEPVTAKWLAWHTGQAADEVEERALQRWQRFLRPGRQDGVPTWAVVHQSFADFLAHKVDLPITHKTISSRYLDSPERWPQHAGYAFRHLSAHLARAGMLAELGDLIENPAWYRAQLDHDPVLSAYVEDVNRALELAEQEGAEGLPRVVAWSLLYASVRSRATQVPVEALETMVLLGDSERALGYARLITDSEQQAKAYRRLGTLLYERGKQARGVAILERALAAAANIPYEFLRSQALRDVALAMAQAGDSQGALAAAANIPYVSERSRALADVALAMAQAGAKATLVQEWVLAAFGRARIRGRTEVWKYIGAFAPVLAGLGVLGKTWERIKAVEAVLKPGALV